MTGERAPDPCKRCGGPDDRYHDLTSCVAKLTADRRRLEALVDAHDFKVELFDGLLRDCLTLAEWYARHSPDEFCRERTAMKNIQATRAAKAELEKLNATPAQIQQRAERLRRRETVTSLALEWRALDESEPIGSPLPNQKLGELALAVDALKAADAP